MVRGVGKAAHHMVDIIRAFNCVKQEVKKIRYLGVLVTKIEQKLRKYSVTSEETDK